MTKGWGYSEEEQRAEQERVRAAEQAEKDRSTREAKARQDAIDAAEGTSDGR